MSKLPAKVFCTACGSDQLEEVMSLGRQPLSTHFGEFPSDEKLEHHLSFGFCRQCSTIQLIKRFPLGLLQKKSPAIAFREPQKHLQATLDKIIGLHGVTKESRFLGLSYIDNDLLNVLIAVGYDQLTHGDYVFFDHWQDSFGLETIQRLISDPYSIQRLKEKNGIFDVVSARFILEHAESALDFLRSLFDIVRPGGYVVIDVPDCHKMIASENHALIWEDHFSYFTMDSLANLISRLGATLVDITQYTYDYEDTIVAIISVKKPAKMDHNINDMTAVAGVKKLLENFNSTFQSKKLSLQAELKVFIDNGEKLAIFGAGHHAAKFVNFYELVDLFEFVVDDNPIKYGLFLPGTALKVLTSKQLIESNVTICISTLSPEAEVKVYQSMPGFFERGGRFIPAFSIIGVSNLE